MNFWQKCSRVPRWLIGLTVGVVFVLIGFFDRQFTDLYRKAVMICLECIGIG